VTLVKFEQCVMHIDHGDRYIATAFSDGSKAEARPNWEPDDIARAKDLGYAGDCWLMTLTHEAFHTFVGELLGFGRSIVLWGVAHGKPKPVGGLPEEGYVTSFQRYLNTGDIDDLVMGLFDRARERHGLYDYQVVRMARGLLVEVHG
jgi:hypothetical protein